MVILDEPTTGLDSVMERAFVEIVKERVADGAAVLLSSHIPSEVESLTNEITIIEGGRLLDSGARNITCKRPTLEGLLLDYYRTEDAS